jgi:flavin reductase (DIM6/NTAB) family NADH-FMN oxidoreductase RutF
MAFAPLVDSPMYIVTCANATERSGCLVGFATQCSIDPPRFLVCLSTANHTFAVATTAPSLAVHLLDEEHHELASHFGEETGDQTDKFADVRWRSGESGAPILQDCEVSFEGLVVEQVPFGDHVGFVLAPLDDVDARDAVHGNQLKLRDVADLRAGHPAS